MRRLRGRDDSRSTQSSHTRGRFKCLPVGGRFKSPPTGSQVAVLREGALEGSVAMMAGAAHSSLDSRASRRAVTYNSVTLVNAASTFFPVMALVGIQVHPSVRHAWSMSAGVTFTCSSRSVLFNRTTTGMSPATDETDWCHRRRPSTVSRRVASATRRTPFALKKYASFSSSRKPGLPMMSHIVAVTPIWDRGSAGSGTAYLLESTFAPRVVTYRSSNVFD